MLACPLFLYNFSNTLCSPPFHTCTPLSLPLSAALLCSWLDFFQVTPRNVEYQLPPPTDPQDLLLLSLFCKAEERNPAAATSTIYPEPPVFGWYFGIPSLLLRWIGSYVIIITRIITTPACLPVLLATLTWPRRRKRRRWLVLGASNLLGSGSQGGSSNSGRE